jgi:hypothetical protein
MIEQGTTPKTIECQIHHTIWEGEADWFQQMRDRGYDVVVRNNTSTHITAVLPLPVARILVDRVRAYTLDDGISTAHRTDIRDDQVRLLNHLEQQP